MQIQGISLSAIKSIYKMTLTLQTMEIYSKRIENQSNIHNLNSSGVKKWYRYGVTDMETKLTFINSSALTRTT